MPIPLLVPIVAAVALALTSEELENDRKRKGFKVNQVVCYSATWVRSTGQVATNDPCIHENGIIVEFVELGSTTILAVVRWSHGETRKVNVGNLARPGSIDAYEVAPR